MALSDYQRIEYVEGQNNGYLNTGKTVNRDTYIFLQGYANVNAGSAQYLWGAFSSNTKQYSFRYSTNNNYIWRYVSNTDRTITPVGDVPIQVIQYYDGEDVYCEVMDLTNFHTEWTSATRSGSTNTSNNVYLLARNGNGTADYFAMGSRISEFALYASYDDPDPYLHLVPVREKVDVNPRVGMYDLVAGTVIWSSGSAGLIAGPDLTAGLTAKVKVNGSWEEGTPYIKVSGSWEQAADIKIKVSGSWEDTI